MFRLAALISDLSHWSVTDLRIITFPVAMIALLAGSLTYYWLDWDWRNDVHIISDDTITHWYTSDRFSWKTCAIRSWSSVLTMWSQ